MSFLTDLFFISLIVLTGGAIILLLRYMVKLRKGDPTIWEGSIRKFEKQDQKASPLAGSLLFTGSSSIVYWKTLKEDMHPLPVLNRGFGGSRVPDVTHYVDRIVVPYQPRGIVFYAGENDITGLIISKKHTAEMVHSSFQKFCMKVHSALPEVPIYFISIKPPKRRKKFWPEMQKANQLIKDYCESDENLNYIDIVPPMLEASGNARPDLFRWDGIHMNAKGYTIWRDVIHPVLMAAFP